MRLSKSMMRLNARRSFRLALLSGLLLTGCNGQKYSLPSFAWKASNTSTKTAEAKPKETKAPESTAAAGLSHIALNEAVPFDSDDTLAEAGVIPASGRQPEQPGGSARLATEEIDEAFRQRTPRGPQERQPMPTAAAIQPYESVVSAVDQGESHLSALKQSLQDLNGLEPSAESTRTPEATNPLAIATSPSSVAESAADPTGMDWANDTPTTTIATPDETGQVHLGSISPGLDSQEFPWAVSPQVNQSSAGVTGVGTVDYSLDRARQLLAKSKSLLQQNNFFAAFDVARTAQSLLQKTQVALLPGEVTPEQILAEIAERQLHHERQLAEARQRQAAESGQNVVATEVRPDAKQLPEILPIPVKIDLSSDSVNLGRRQQKSAPNDIVKFEEAVVLSNQAARLPSINPGQSLTELLPQRESHQVARQETSPAPNAATTQINNGPLSLPQTPSENRKSEATEFRLTAGEADESADSILPGDLPLSLGPLPTFSEGDSAPGNARVAGPRMGSQPSEQNAPLLMAPQGTQSDAADLDDIFAADFADVTADSSAELEEASLLIDEADLTWEADQKPLLTGNNLTLILCGLAVGLVLLFRWRR